MKAPGLLSADRLVAQSVFCRIVKAFNGARNGSAYWPHSVLLYCSRDWCVWKRMRRRWNGRG